MKTKPHSTFCILRYFFTIAALCGLCLCYSPKVFAQTDPIEPRLTAERQGDAVALRWIGGSGIRLQRADCACPDGALWQDVPGTDTNCTVLMATGESAEFYRLVDAFADTDADFLTRGEEEAGWTIYVDTSGYCDPRIVEQRDVSSDPELGDTDGDGLSDAEEWLLGTDPRAVDTDRDGLTDYEEWFRWMTSPTSVDTDGDARGPDHNLPPSATLFDGNELRLLHTSPTLDDTDGDGRTDYEEYDQPGRNLLVAQLPKLDVEFVDEVDIRLDVEYAEEAGASRQYGGQLTTSHTDTEETSSANTVKASVTAGAESKAGFFDGGVGTKLELTAGYEHVWTSTTSDSDTMENSYSDYTTDSRTRTETAASGSMSGSIRLVNTGPITYTLTDFGLDVRYWSPGSGATNGSFKTLATLVPALGAGGITLAPGDSTPVLQVQATGLNASRVKEFMARPNSLYLEPAFYELENAEGLNFDYLEEVTRWRTARVEIDYGDGRNEEYRVATNVERNQDGSYAGVTLGNVLNNMLHIPFQTAPRQTVEPGSTSNERVLTSLNHVNMISPANGFWVVVGYGEGTSPANVDFENIALHAGNQLLLMFVRDEDGDGLFAAEEQHYGTSDTAAPEVLDSMDTDADGLWDEFEARTGWNVVLPTRTYHVYSDPRTTDQDGDGLTDYQESRSSAREPTPLKLIQMRMASPMTWTDTRSFPPECCM